MPLTKWGSLMGELDLGTAVRTMDVMACSADIMHVFGHRPIHKLLDMGANPQLSN
jgi:hypothetical protein